MRSNPGGDSNLQPPKCKSGSLPHSHCFLVMLITQIRTCRDARFHRFDGHFPGNPGLAGCPLDFLLHSFLQFILLGHTQTLHILFDTVPPSLPRMTLSVLFKTKRVVYLVLSTSVVIQRLIQSTSSFHSTFLNNQILCSLTIAKEVML